MILRLKRTKVGQGKGGHKCTGELPCKRKVATSMCMQINLIQRPSQSIPGIKDECTHFNQTVSVDQPHTDPQPLQSNGMGRLTFCVRPAFAVTALQERIRLAFCLPIIAWGAQRFANLPNAIEFARASGVSTTTWLYTTHNSDRSKQRHGQQGGIF